MDRKIHRAKEILEIESNAIRNMPVDKSLLKAVDMISACKGKIITSGMGKAGIIARKLSSTLSSTGTPSVFLHPGEAQHGDMGMIGPKDILFVFSHSGKTRELLEMVAISGRLYADHKVPVIAVTSHPESELRNVSDVVLDIGDVKEVCPLGMAPTTSTTCMLAMSDVVAVLVMEEKNFTKEEFFKRHHGGYLGQQKDK